MYDFICQVLYLCSMLKNIKHVEHEGVFFLCVVNGSAFWLWNALQLKKSMVTKPFTCGIFILIKLGSKLFCFTHKSSNFDVDLDLMLKC